MTSKKATSNKEDSGFLGGQATSNVRTAQRSNKNTGRNRKNWGHYKFTLFYLKHSWKTIISIYLSIYLSIVIQLIAVKRRRAHRQDRVERGASRVDHQGVSAEK